MIRVKDRSVRIAQLHQSLWHAVYQFDELRRKHGLNTDTVITSGNDGKHSYGSLHHMDRAVDLRTKDCAPGVMETIVSQLQKALGVDFDVIWEYVGTPNEHLHIESHPK